MYAPLPEAVDNKGNFIFKEEIGPCPHRPFFHLLAAG
jgi:hypothetical protein